MSFTVSPRTGAQPIASTMRPTPPAGGTDAQASPAISNSSVVHISEQGAAMASAVRTKRYIPTVAATPEIERGKSYLGTVKSIQDFGAFIEIAPGRQGLLHVSEVTGTRQGPANAIYDYLQIGQTIEVEVTHIDTARQRISLGLPATSSA